MGGPHYDSARAASQKRIFSTLAHLPWRVRVPVGRVLPHHAGSGDPRQAPQERRSPGELIPIGHNPPSFVPPSADELQNWAEGPMYFCSRAMDAATSPVTALLLAKRLGKRYDVGVKHNLEDHFKAQMPKMPAPLSFDNVFTAKIPPPVCAAVVRRQAAGRAAHSAGDRGVPPHRPRWLKGYAPEGYLQEYLASLCRSRVVFVQVVCHVCVGHRGVGSVVPYCGPTVL